MRLYAVPLIVALLLSSAPLCAIPLVSETAAQKADRYVSTLADSDAFLRELRDTIELARDGEYGKISPADLSRLDAARARIEALLDGHQHARQLTTEARIELFNAQEEIVAIVRNDDKSRRVCVKVRGTGTRIARAECLTVAQREQRARETREASRVQQGFREPHCLLRIELGQVPKDGC